MTLWVLTLHFGVRYTLHVVLLVCLLVVLLFRFGFSVRFVCGVGCWWWWMVLVAGFVVGFRGC